MSSTLNDSIMRAYLSRSIAGTTKTREINQNKVNGLLAEVDFRRYLSTLGYSNRVSLGGWIARRVGAEGFGSETVAILPEILISPTDISASRPPPEPPRSLHTICATFYQIGIKSFFAYAQPSEPKSTDPIKWMLTRIGTPQDQPWLSLDDALDPILTRRSRRYEPLRFRTDVAKIPSARITEEFLKESIRVHIQRRYITEISDIDGILWGEEKTYPLEIKEKTVARDRNIGDYFGIDAGPFVKLAFYAAKRGNLHSLFIVREIASTQNRELVSWWAITFERLARFASWVPQGGGTSMGGGRSSVIKIPKSAFHLMDSTYLSSL